MRPLCGHVADTAEAIASSETWGAVAGAIAPVATDLDQRRFAPPVVQQIANNCCAIAMRAAAYATAKAAGRPIPLPSCLALYAGARLQAGLKPPLPDTGSSLRAMLKFSETYGFVSDERWPERPENVNVVPPVDVFEKGQDVPVLSGYSLAVGSALDVGLVSALQRLRFPVIAMPVDDAFAATRDEVYDAQGGALIGFHAMMVAGLDRSLDAFILQNSWGEDFGDRGFVLVRRALLTKLVTDGVVIDCVPGGAA